MTQDKECENDCVEKLLFPKEIKNRPGLPHIDYCIGTYADFLEALLRKLNTDPVLVNWTHREPDDPGIALLEGASILGDILTFYQELYANEAYIRTAQWRESIADLVRLTGYRLAPGVGGKAIFAFEVKDKDGKPVIIPGGFPVKAQVEGLEQAADFETLEETTAYPALNKFHLYRPRLPMENIKAGINCLEIHQVNGLKDFSSINSVEIKPGDRIMLVPDTKMFDQQTAYFHQQKSEILIVTEVKKILDRTIIYFEGSLTLDRGQQVTAYCIGRTFSHFGYNLPDKIIKYNEDKRKVEEIETNFLRKIYWTHQEYGSDADFYSVIKKTEMPLDQEVNDLAAGGLLICQGITNFDGISDWVPFTVVKKIMEVGPGSVKWGNMTGASTVVVVDSKLIKNNYILNEKADIRQMKFHEVTGPEMVLRAPSAWESGPFTGNTLNFLGTDDQVAALAGRKLILEGKDGTTFTALVIDTDPDFSPSIEINQKFLRMLHGQEAVFSKRAPGRRRQNDFKMWPITLDKKPDVFLLEDFEEENPTINVYGNLAEANQGKTEKEAVLGNGDNRQEFQTFKLPKSPLTYHNQAGETPPEVPELEIYVNDRLWNRVPSFFGQSAKEQIYIVREDADNNSWVQFGDGKTGARLPSGIRNVKARYRTGIGAYGELREETKPQAQGKLERLEKVYMPEPASGGDEPETGDNAREAAPGKTQSLGRLVSLKDYESEALATAGVTKANAKWEVTSEHSAVILTLLMESGRSGEINDVQAILNKYNKCRGPQRFPIIVIPGKRSYIHIRAQFGLNPSYREDVVIKAIQTALGVLGEEGNGIDGSEGLFGLKQRRFGQKAYASRIEGTIQNVAGVMWAKVKALESLGEADEPSTLEPPLPDGAPNSFLACDDEHILCLHTAHLQLSVSKEETAERC
jgi:hypothetical protein